LWETAHRRPQNPEDQSEETPSLKLSFSSQYSPLSCKYISLDDVAKSDAAAEYGYQEGGGIKWVSPFELAEGL